MGALYLTSFPSLYSDIYRTPKLACATNKTTETHLGLLNFTFFVDVVSGGVTWLQDQQGGAGACVGRVASLPGLRQGLPAGASPPLLTPPQVSLGQLRI